MTDWKHDKVVQVNIGYDSTDAGCVAITNVVSFASRVVSPDGDLVDPLTMINQPNPGGVHQNHKYWELELVLDTNYYHLNPHQYWAYYQDVDGTAGKAIVWNGANNDIEYFAVFMREWDGIITKLVYTKDVVTGFDYGATDVLWCVGETSEFNNETGTRHQTVTFKFIAFQERERTLDVGDPAVAEAAEGEGIIKRIDNVRTDDTTAVNILRFTEDFVMKMTPRFIPNTYQGVGLKQDEKYRVITVVVDSETDAFDTMLTITAAQAAATGQFLAVFTLDDATGGTETWTYDKGTTYMSNRREGETSDTSERSTIEYEFISHGEKTIG